MHACVRVLRVCVVVCVRVCASASVSVLVLAYGCLYVHNVCLCVLMRLMCVTLQVFSLNNELCVTLQVFSLGNVDAALNIYKFRYKKTITAPPTHTPR